MSDTEAGERERIASRLEIRAAGGCNARAYITDPNCAARGRTVENWCSNCLTLRAADLLRTEPGGEAWTLDDLGEEVGVIIEEWNESGESRMEIAYRLQEPPKPEERVVRVQRLAAYRPARPITPVEPDPDAKCFYCKHPWSDHQEPSYPCRNQKEGRVSVTCVCEGFQTEPSAPVEPEKDR